MISFVLLLLPCFVLGVEFIDWNGVSADFCNKNLDSSVKDCPYNSQAAPPSVTVAIPHTSFTVNNIPDQTISTIGLPKSQTTSLALATGADSCAMVDAATFTTAATNTIGTVLTFALPAAWRSVDPFGAPRLVCWSPTSVAGNTDFRYTGFKLSAAWNCSADVTSDFLCTGDQYRAAVTGLSGNTKLETQQFLARTQCCASRLGLFMGQCVNPNVEACCGGVAYEIGQEKCCNPATQHVVPLDSPCSCSVDADCGIGSNVTDWACCRSSKYSEVGDWAIQGQCYRTSREGCCDTGSVFDLGSQQCCPINGVQTLNKPCPCSGSAHCQAGQQCCMQSAPLQRESPEGCSPAAFFPTGSGPAEVARCPGTCFDPSFSVCCNGVKCIKNYERCCNSTCCNRFSGTCVEGLRPAQRGLRNNPRNLNLNFQVCSRVEFLSTVKAFWVFVFPAGLLAASLAGLALALVFASKATPRKLSFIEYLMIGVAILTMFLAMTLYFSPAYKYGIWIVFAMALVILAATARIRWLNVLTILVLLLTLIYVFDPFFGNAWFTLASNRTFPVGESAPADLETSGLLHAVQKSWRTVATTKTQNFCTQHYDWFMLDPQLRDTERIDNPEIVTFGYCSRGWVTALLFFSVAVMALIFSLLVLTILGLFFRFKKAKIELEVQEEALY